MKIAVLHNYMDNIGGAERVGLTLAKELPADIYTTQINHKAIHRMGFNIQPKSIGHVPLNAPYRQQLALLRFRHLKLKGYDRTIIDGDWAMSGAVRNKPNMWYVHSPIREIWDLHKYTRQNIVPLWKRPTFDAWVKLNRHLNRKYVRHVNTLVCNSQNTQNRVKRYLKRNATIIPPPIETKQFHYDEPQDYWLSVNRLITHKRVDMQLRAFAKMPNKKLLVVGCSEKSNHFTKYRKYIERICPPNVKILTQVPQDELANLYAQCRGFITTSKDEDFGMTAVEAMASGKPVIAPNEGGYKESVIDQKTGHLLTNIDANKIQEAVKSLDENPQSYKKASLRRAAEFDTSRFVKRIRAEL